jgi:SAM-dependent methyltransferase
MHTPAFDHVTDVYEASIDWPKRLANEGPFFRSVLESRQVHTVLDAACGTGHHAAMFHGWGLDVKGADISAAMIARAREQFGDPPGLRWVVRAYEQVVPETFDAVVCVGNSLALAPDMATARTALAHMTAAARRCLVVHVLNLWALPDGPAVWQRCVRADLPGGPSLIVKGVHRQGAEGYIEVLVSTLETPPRLHSETMRFVGLEAGDIEQTLRAAGAATVAFYGNYQRQPYDRAGSVDLIAVAEK